MPSSSTVAFITPITRGLKVWFSNFLTSSATAVAFITPITRGLKVNRALREALMLSPVAFITPITRGLKEYRCGCTLPHELGCIHNPDNKGTERQFSEVVWMRACIGCIHNPDNKGTESPTWAWLRLSFPTGCIHNPDNKGTESSPAHSGRHGGKSCIHNPDNKGTERKCDISQYFPSVRVAFITPITRGLKGQVLGRLVVELDPVAFITPITRGLKETVRQGFSPSLMGCIHNPDNKGTERADG